MQITHHRFSRLFKALILACCGFFLPSCAFSNCYIVGATAGPTTFDAVPYLWIVDTAGNVDQITLPGTSSIASCIAASDTTLYIGGAIEAFTYGSLWITNLDGSNPQLIALTDSYAESVSGIAIENSKIYMAATNQGVGAYLLITDLDGTNLQQITLDTGFVVYASAVAANDSYAYVVGSNDNVNTVLWICNASDGSIVSTVTLGANSDGGKGVTLTSSSVYVSASNSTYYVADLDGSNVQTISPVFPVDLGGSFGGIAVGSEIYIAVQGSAQSHPPQLQIVTLEGGGFETIALTETDGSANDVALSDSNLYLVGFLGDFENVDDAAYLWITGLDGSNVQSILLKNNAYAQAITLGAAGPSPVVNPFWKAFQLYNPVKMLKGIAP